METAKITGNRIREYLEQGKRFDGRKPDEFREISIEVGVSKNAEGSARVKLGNSEVLVGIKLGIGEPYADSPNKGNLMVTSELMPLSSKRFESGPPTIQSIELARVIDRMIRESKIIDLEKLCIEEGKKVWTVFIDIYSMNADGNLLDAAGIGAVLALKNAKIPKYDKKEEKVLYGELSDENVPLKKDLPVSITVHKIGKNLIVDPSLEEEDISETRMTIGIINGSIHSMQKGNAGAFEMEEFDNAVDLAEKVWKDVFAKLEKYLK